MQHGDVAIVYDGDGNRVSETVGGVTTNYVVDTQNPTGYAQVLDELQGGAVVRRYAWGHWLLSETQQSDSTWKTSFYGYDGHGSVRFLTDANGVVTDTYDYDAFGNLISQTGTTPNNYLFAGEQFDPVLGLYYNRARYLDVRMGRFWGMDTYEGFAAAPPSLHKYSYANSSPVDFSDSSGLLTDYTDHWRGVEVQIQVQYWMQYSQNDILWGGRTQLGVNPLLKPDIFDKTRSIWMEIKPFSESGIADAQAAWRRYTDNFGPLGYQPDGVWKPPIQPILWNNRLFLVQNVQGILFCSCDSDQRRFKEIRSFVEANKLIQQLKYEERMGDTIGLGLLMMGSVALGMLIYYGTRAGATANTLQLTDIQNSVGNATMLQTMVPAA